MNEVRGGAHNVLRGEGVFGGFRRGRAGASWLLVGVSGGFGSAAGNGASIPRGPRVDRSRGSRRGKPGFWGAGRPGMVVPSRSSQSRRPRAGARAGPGADRKEPTGPTLRRDPVRRSATTRSPGSLLSRSRHTSTRG